MNTTDKRVDKAVHQLVSLVDEENYLPADYCEEIIRELLTQHHQDLMREVVERLEKLPVYYRSKFSQDCSREETEEEKSTEMWVKTQVLEALIEAQTIIKSLKT